MEPYGADISETRLLEQYPKALETLLRDHTTGRNIFWATDSYADRGEGYQYSDPITVGSVTGGNGMVVRPRALKSRDEQQGRTRGMAEVFTPSWVCNVQNNVVDQEWFGRPGVFNVPTGDGRGWEPAEGPVAFPEGKTWRDYVRSTRLEIACGEAPYLVSRYDTTTGRPISLRRRVGMLDRKLRVVGENTKTTAEWLAGAQEAYKATMAYEWQGDNLLLAREALLVSFVEYFRDKFGEMPRARSVEFIAYIVSWNVWQMDGLRGVVPGSCRDGVVTVRQTLFGPEESVGCCPGCRQGGVAGHNGQYCLLRDWGRRDPATGQRNRKFRFVELLQ